MDQPNLKFQFMFYDYVERRFPEAIGKVGLV